MSKKKKRRKVIVRNRSELMTFIGLVEGTKGYIFMRNPNNVVFTTIQALFDETSFQNVHLCIVWDIHLWVFLLMTCRMSIMNFRMMRMRIMGVVYHQSHIIIPECLKALLLTSSHHHHIRCYQVEEDPLSCNMRIMRMFCLTRQELQLLWFPGN
jgi:hypothetical protein